MLKNPDDRRARRTRKLLKESLLNLMSKKRFSDISVSDVTEGADMNRATFYLHYANTQQLLQSVEKDLLAQAQELLDAHMQETIEGGSIRPVLEPILDFVVEERKLCTMLFENDRDSQFTEHLLQLIQHNGAEIVEARFYAQDKQRLSYLLGFVTCGLMGMIRTWFQGGMELPKEELLTAAEQMVDGAVIHLIEEAETC